MNIYKPMEFFRNDSYMREDKLSERRKEAQEDEAEKKRLRNAEITKKFLASFDYKQDNIKIKRKRRL